MEMQQIRYFLTLAETLNFTRAAEECHVSQPALTRAIQGLEAELGGDLILRERQHSSLTELGRRMLPFLRQCYESAVSAQTLAHALKTSVVAPLSLAVSNAINIQLFMPSISELFRAYPGLQLRIKRGTGAEVLDLLKEGAAELAIAGPLGEGWDRLDAWALFTEPFELVVGRGHALARRNDVEMHHLVGERLLTRAGCEMADPLVRCLAAHGLADARTHEAVMDHDLIALIEADAGIGFLPASAPDSASLRRRPVRGLDLLRPVSVYGVAGRRRAPVATALLNLLRAAEWPTYEATS